MAPAGINAASNVAAQKKLRILLFINSPPEP
jgi:hypothetical protein